MRLAFKSSVVSVSNWDLSSQVQVVVLPHPTELSWKQIRAELEECRERLAGPDSHIAQILGVSESSSQQSLAARVALTVAAKTVQVPFFSTLSHTKGWSAASIMPVSEGVEGLGIDIESRNRELSMRLGARIRSIVPNSQEGELERWVRYEAAYKACYGDATLKSADTTNFETTSLDIESEVKSEAGLIISVAISKPRNSRKIEFRGG